MAYLEIPGLNMRLVKHKIDIEKGTKPVKQASRNFQSELEVQIKQEI